MEATGYSPKFTTDFRGMAKANAFIQTDKRFPSYFGGYGNAKTTSLCVKALKHLYEYPGSSGALCRNTNVQLDRTTRKEFFKLLGVSAENARKHPDIAYWNKQSNYLRLKNGSDLTFIYLDGDRAIENVRSMNLSFAGIDQAEEISSAAFEEFDARIRFGDCPHWVGTVGNPAGHNWIWRKYYRDFINDADFIMWVAATMDNPHLPDDFVPNLLKNHSEDWVKRFVYGSFDVFQGQIYEEFNEQVHVIDPMSFDPNMIAGWGADFGLVNPSVFLRFAIDYDGNLIVFDEIYNRQKLAPFYAEELRKHGVFNKDGRQDEIIGDPSVMNITATTGTALEEEYWDAGIAISPGNKRKRSPGIQRVKAHLRIDWDQPHPYKPGEMGRAGGAYRGKDGEYHDVPGIYFTRNCSHTIEELPNYQWKQLNPNDEGKKNAPEEPLEVDDHCCDALRYFIMDYISTKRPKKPRRKSILEKESEMYRDREVEDWRVG